MECVLDTARADLYLNQKKKNKKKKYYLVAYRCVVCAVCIYVETDIELETFYQFNSNMSTPLCVKGGEKNTHTHTAANYISPVDRHSLSFLSLTE